MLQYNHTILTLFGPVLTDPLMLASLGYTFHKDNSSDKQMPKITPVSFSYPCTPEEDIVEVLKASAYILQLI